MQQTNNYFYGNETDQYSFFRIPKALITNARFRGVSTDAKLLYGLFLDRMALSTKNGWCDDNGRVYIHYKLEEIMETMNCAHGKAIKLLAELDVSTGIGLIERVKQGQGKPTIIYVLRFIERCCNKENRVGSARKKARFPKSGSQDFRKSELKTSENQTSRLPKNRGADLGKAEVYLYSKNKTEKNKTDLVIAAEPVSDWDRQVAQVKKQIGYEAYARLYPDDTEDVLELLLEVYNTDDAVIRINSKDYSSDIVQCRLKNLSVADVGRVLENLQTRRSRIGDRRNHLLNSLFTIADQAADL